MVEPGVFEVLAQFLGMSLPKFRILLEDLLSSQINSPYMSIFEGNARINVNLFLHLINEKFLS